MKKTTLMVCALVMLTACTKSNSGSDTSSSARASKAFVENFTANDSNVVYFAYDKSSLSSEAKKILMEKAKPIQDCQQLTFTIEGHADQRGTAEYNMGLGERRANAVKSFLTNEHGVSSDRLTVISYGKEKLADDNMTAEAYAKNRRSVVVPN